ncbi:hypothetical protein [Streptomyces sp. NPDC020141]|uniref:hypothetical protein n=1 Tax=Streptomyces sp. NPDC020141 TaxID=3365065 RepID=UPI0037982644
MPRPVRSGAISVGLVAVPVGTPAAKAIEIAAFVPSGSAGPVRIGDSRHLAADGQVAAGTGKADRRPSVRASSVPAHDRARGGSLLPRARW